MAQGQKRLEAMRSNPQGDWRLADIELVCRTFGLSCDAPKRGSHFTISHPAHAKILTIPSRRPIKPVYIKALVSYILEVHGTSDDGSA